MKHFNYIVAQSNKEAIKEKAKHDNAYFIAGGSNLIDMMKEGIQRPDHLVDVLALPLKAIKLEEDHLHLGALISNTVAAENEIVLQNAPLIGQSIAKGATQQIRNMATIGGNLMQETRCPYFYDISAPCNRRENSSGCSALMTGNDRGHAIFGRTSNCIAVHPSDMAVGMQALKTIVNLQGSKSSRSLPLNQFYQLPSGSPITSTSLQPGELITSVEIPLGLGFNHSAYLKVRDRRSYAFALISGAVAFNIQDDIIRKAGIAAGGVGTVPWPFDEVEAYLEGKSATEANFRAAAKIAIEGAQPGKQSGFKVALLEKILIRTMLMAKKTPYGTSY